MKAAPLKQYHISAQPRHLRYIYFVSHDYPYEKLFQLMSRNQLLWGGRYNPIIPVKEGKVSEEYKAILQFYDPDFIFYTSDVDPLLLYDLAPYNPKEYILLKDPQSQTEITGLNGLYFLSQISQVKRIILPQQLYLTESPLLSYYDINFGIGTNISNMDVELTSENQFIAIKPENFNDLHRIIYSHRPITKTLLAEHNFTGRVLRTPETSSSDLEIIISKDEQATDDLIYFWNRKLFEAKSILYITLQQLEILKEDPYFGHALFGIENKNYKVTSISLEIEEVLKIIDGIFKPLKLMVTFSYAAVESFPFSVMDGNGRNYLGSTEDTSHQHLTGEKGLFNLPKLSFTDKVRFPQQKWAIDIEIRRLDQYAITTLRFPFTTNTHLFFAQLGGRITKNCHITVYNNNNQESTYEIHVPNSRQIIQQLITNPVLFGKATDISIKEIRNNDSGNRLAAFIDTFDNDFNNIDDFFCDPFWVETFEYLIKNNKQAGDAITFNEIKQRCIEKLAQHGIKLKDKTESHQNKENLERSLKSTLQRLCTYQVFFKGFKLKCKTCSSNFWYHINEVKESLTCKGCFNEFSLPVETNFYYKLNDLIKNNIFQSKDQRDGNLTVVRTLASLRKRSRSDFFYLPQIDLIKDYRTPKPFTDLDIVCIIDGKIFIGEAKHNSTAFFDKNSEYQTCLDTLFAIALEILPDTIVLSCYDNANNYLNKAQKTLMGKFYDMPKHLIPKIEIIDLSLSELYNQDEYMYFQE